MKKELSLKSQLSPPQRVRDVQYSCTKSKFPFPKKALPGLQSFHPPRETRSWRRSPSSSPGRAAPATACWRWLPPGDAAATARQPAGPVAGVAAAGRRRDRAFRSGPVAAAAGGGGSLAGA